MKKSLFIIWTVSFFQTGLLIWNCSPDYFRDPNPDCGIVLDKFLYERTNKLCYVLKVENEVTKEIDNLCVTEQNYNTHNINDLYCKLK